MIFPDLTREVGLAEDLEMVVVQDHNAAQDHKQKMGRNEGRVLVDQ